MKARHYWVAVAALCGALASPALAADIRLPDGPGANLVYAKCQTCHDLQYVVDGKGLLPSQWAAVLASMRDYGLQINQAESQQVLQYLTTYLGTKPPPAAATANAAPASGAATTAKAQPASAIDGRAVYVQNCATCHGAEGRGQPGYFPPLAGNADLAANDAFPVLVVLNGLTGPIEVEGRTFDGSMPPFGHLSDGEIAAVVDYVRSAWGATPALAGAVIHPDAVAQQRRQPLSPADVHAYRERMKR